MLLKIENKSLFIVFDYQRLKVVPLSCQRIKASKPSIDIYLLHEFVYFCSNYENLLFLDTRF